MYRMESTHKFSITSFKIQVMSANRLGWKAPTRRARAMIKIVNRAHQADDKKVQHK